MMRVLVRRAALAACVAASTLPVAAHAQATDSIRVERVAEVGRIWGLVRYFHPAGERLRTVWDSATVAALAKLRPGMTDAEFAARVDSMLSALGDPATRVVARRPTPSGSSTASLGVSARATKDSVLVISATDYGAIARDIGGALTRLDSLAGAGTAGLRGIVVDLRRRNPAPQVGYATYLWGNTALPATWITRAISIPGARRVQHVGMRAEIDVGSAYTTETVWTRGGELQPAAGATEIPLVLVVNGESEIPPVFIALRWAGRATVVAEDGVGSDGAIETFDVTLSGSAMARIRLTELADESGVAVLSADTTVASGAGDAALDVALRWAHAGRTPSRDATPSAPPAWRVQPASADEAGGRESLPSREQRVLALFQIWNAVHYFYPHPSQIRGDWTRALADEIPRFEGARDSLEYAREIARAMARIGDTHAFTWGRAMSGYFGSMPAAVQLRWVEGRPVVAALVDTAAARAAGVRVGDEIVSVDGKSVAERLGEILPFVSASREEVALRDAMLFLLNGPNETRVTVEMRRGAGGPFATALPRRQAYWEAGDTGGGAIIRVLDGSIGYLDLSRLVPAMVDSAITRLQGTRALVLDLRGYPQGTDQQIVGWIANGPQKLYATVASPLVRAPFGWSGGSVDVRQFVGPGSGPRYAGRVFVLVDERTQSASEHMALQLRAAGAVLVGGATAGADGNVTGLRLPGNLTVRFTGSTVRTPEAESIQGRGVRPDIVVRPTVAGLRAGRDEVLDRAIRELPARP